MGGCPKTLSCLSDWILVFGCLVEAPAVASARCGCEARPVLPQLLVCTSTAQLPLAHPCVSQKGFLVVEHHR